MNQLLKLLLLSLGVATLVVILNAGFMRNPSLERLVWPFVVSLTYATVIGAMAWYILPKVAPKMSKSGGILWLQLLAVLTMISFAGGTLAFGVMTLQPFVDLRMSYTPSMVICLILTLGIGSISYVIERARYRVQESTLALRNKELERERALQSATDAKLRSLESRIHPHFLFNTLNSISSLVRTNPTEAEATIERLAALLRFSLDRHGNLVTLEDEAKITRDYLDIEKTRFGDRLRYRIEIPEDLLGTMVPAMSLQTLAENSVKHAVGAQRAATEITVSAHKVNQLVELSVVDSGPGFTMDSLPTGHGLDTLKQRLETLFGDKSTLTSRQLTPGMEVAFRVPC